MMKQVVAFVLMMAFIMTVYAKSGREARLFQKYPLEGGIAELFAEANQKVARSGLTDAAVSALARQEDRMIEELTRAEDLTVKEAKDAAKPQWFGYFYNKPIDTVFHNYDSESAVIYGTADYETVKRMLEKENYSPIALGRSKRAMLALHVTKHKDTSIGAYNELTLTVHATPSEKDAQGKEKVLGVSYDNENTASLLYPLFGKLEDHHRHFILSSVSDHGHDFHRKIHGYPTEVASATVASEASKNKKGEDSTYFSFDFKQADGKTIIKGKIEEDNTWGAWAKSSYKIFRALGLSGIIDLWYSKHVPLKYASPLNMGAKVSSHFTDFEGLRIHDLSDYSLQWNQNTDLGRKLEQMDFKPEMVTRMPKFMSAVGVPSEQADDLDYLTAKLTFEEPSKKADEEL